MDEKQARQLSVFAERLGPGARAYVEYLAGEFWARTRTAAIDAGLSPLEVEQVTRTTVAGAVKAFASASQHARQVRAFTGRRN